MLSHTRADWLQPAYIFNIFIIFYIFLIKLLAAIYLVIYFNGTKEGYMLVKEKTNKTYNGQQTKAIQSYLNSTVV